MLKCFFIIMFALLMALPAAAEKDINKGNQGYSMANMEFIFVPGGCFRMGSATGNYSERPVHDACVSDFFIGKYEVTQGQWRKIMDNNPSRFSQCGEDCPVEQVSWRNAQDFINRLNILTGKKYRLPTEAEWEYACTGGGKEERYCGGNDLDAVAWHERNSGGRTHPVGQKKPNNLGIYDMSGNVWEWVQDYWGDYPDIRQQDPTGPKWSTNSMRRGGSWQYGPDQARAVWRSSGYTDDHALDIGFRLVLPAAR
ncbi:MAG TPA: formylglycine-generating enzyme family protein [Desulfuromonadaceae bacterium]|jgi:formylglycine-generating enzyme required for sulfatase activity